MQNEKKIKPFLRWAGGKSRLVPKLLEYMPAPGSYKTYIEPFLGSGALFFALRPHSAILADMNGHLINCYQQIAVNPTGVWEELQKHRSRDSKDYYLKVREIGLTQGTEVARAAIFLYLNKTAFNGIFRVNKSGKFNVPYGKISSGPAWPPLDELRNVANCFQGTRFFIGPFEDTCKKAFEGDFIYLDPPYPPLRKSANFTHYTADGFSYDDQMRVAEVFSDLDRKGCLVMMSNSDQPSIRDLYQNDKFNLSTIEVMRFIGSNGDRFKVNELVVTNYPIQQEQLQLIE